MEYRSVSGMIKLTIVIYFTEAFCASEEHRILTSVYLDRSLRNFHYFNENIYIGGTSRLYVLDKDLNIVQSVKTCEKSEPYCIDINKVLLVNEEHDELITCGTGNAGLCEVRKIEDIQTVQKQRSVHLKVSTDIQRPAHFMITGNNSFMVALTFGSGINAKLFTKGESRSVFTYDYAMCTRHLSSFQTVVSSSSWEKKTLNLELYLDDISKYIIYYKSLFQSNGYNYFVTNQKEFVGASRFITKLGRICANETGYGSYTDIFLQCLDNGTEYNLIQIAELIIVGSKSDSSERVFLGVFRTGNDPEAPSGDSVICMTNLHKIDEAIMAAIKKHAMSCQADDYKKRYLKDIKGNACLPDETEFYEGYFICEPLLPTYGKVIGNVTVTMESVYRINGRDDGTLTAVHGTTMNVDYPVVIVGTSTGKVLHFNLEHDGNILEPYSRLDLDPESPIMKLYRLNDDELFVMSAKKVFKIRSTNCSEFKTCADTAAGRNPLCGWCVYEKRASRMSDCSNATNYWLASRHGCVSMTITPSSIPIPSGSQQADTNVTLLVVNLPEKLTDDVYMCRFKQRSETLGAVSAIEMREAEFICSVLTVSGHGEVTVELLLQTAGETELLLSSAQLMLYECRQFKRCGDCVSQGKESCAWCMEFATCQSEGSLCRSTVVSNVSSCPKLLDGKGRQFLPFGIPTEVIFTAVNLPTFSNSSFEYKCLLPEISVEVPADEENGTISCMLNIPRPVEYSKEKEYMLLIVYGNQTGFSSVIDDEFENIVTGYSCADLAYDCSHCRALNSAQYQCGWCKTSGRCGFLGSVCSFSLTCPAPNVTKVFPEDGPTSGGTLVTIFGSDLGSDLISVDKVEIGNVPCKLRTDTRRRTPTENGDSSAEVPGRLVCVTGATKDRAELTGVVKVTVNGSSSQSDIEFSYKKPSFRRIIPTTGPISGGTMITVFGDNLGIGNRDVTVYLDEKMCLKPELYPLKGITADSAIKCTVPGGYKSNITSVTLYIDGTIVLKDVKMSFVFSSDPKILTIENRRGFTSGGTRVVLYGVDLDHAHDAKLVVSYNGKFMTEDCFIQSSSKGLCKVPEATTALKRDLADKLSEPVKQNLLNVCSDCIMADALVQLDGVSRDFILVYYRDPVLHNLSRQQTDAEMEAKDNRLVIHGDYLTLVATLSDVNVTVGMAKCLLTDLSATAITCIVVSPTTAKHWDFNPEVIVTIGNIRRSVGYFKYSNNSDGIDFETTTVISSAAGAAFVCVVLATVLLCRKYRKRAAVEDYMEMSGTKKDDNQASIIANAHASAHIYDMLAESSETTPNPWKKIW